MKKVLLCLLFLSLFSLLITACERETFSPPEFVELQEGSGTFIDSRDGQEYTWIKLGEQIWMNQNLNYDLDTVLDWAHEPFTLLKDTSDTTSLDTFKIPLSINIDSDQLPEARMGTTKAGRLYSTQIQYDYCPEGWKLPDIFDHEKLYEHLSIPDDDGTVSKEGQQVDALVPEFNSGINWNPSWIPHISKYYYSPKDSSSQYLRIILQVNSSEYPPGVFEDGVPLQDTLVWDNPNSALKGLIIQRGLTNRPETFTYYLLDKYWLWLPGQHNVLRLEAYSSTYFKSDVLDAQAWVGVRCLKKEDE